MTSEYFDIDGLIISENLLELPRSHQLAEMLSSERLAFVQLIECRRLIDENEETSETIVFDVEVERPQQCINDIKHNERIAVRFSSSDNWYPEVLALRKDFPKVPHLNLRSREFPRSLCLYDQSWAEIALRWTPTRFIERIRDWLAQTAKGTLHQDDQPLEPVLFGSGWHVILPSDLFIDDVQNDHIKHLQLDAATSDENCHVLLTHLDPNVGGVSIFAICIKTKPRRQTAISNCPRTIAELHELLSLANVDLRRELSHLFSDIEEKHRSNHKLLIVVAFPLMRDGYEQIEISDIWAFISWKSIAEIGIGIGKWSRAPGENQLGVIIEVDANADGSDIPIIVVSPHFRLTRESAAKASSQQANYCKIVAIGAGAIGAQIIRLLAQSGFGIWTIVDNDWLAPHNLARHTLSPKWIGCYKASALVKELAELYPSDPQPVPIIEDFLHLSSDNKQAITSADLIFDMSASVSVARHLANDIETRARRISIFLNPKGTDIVILFEDTERAVPLDCLEIQYYREIAFNNELVDHLTPPADRTRYSRSCRDISSAIPATITMMLSTVAAQELLSVNDDKMAKAIIWKTNGSPIQIRPITVNITSVCRNKIEEWTLIVSHHVLSKIAEYRSSKLPNETGGVLVGSYDLSRKTVYVADVLPSPPDSDEWPTLYIRGSKDLEKEIARVHKVTTGLLEYIGEWHSHPTGCPSTPSDDDIKVFTWLTENMHDVGLPSLMAIAGEIESSWYIDKISNKWVAQNA